MNSKIDTDYLTLTLAVSQRGIARSSRSVRTRLWLLSRFSALKSRILTGRITLAEFDFPLWVIFANGDFLLL